MRECPTCKRLFEEEVSVCPHDGAPLSLPNPLLGRVVDGRYRIDGLIGTGGMGAVYRATQLNLDRTVAVKVISSALADPVAMDRFKREALVVARLRHPNIVSVYDFGADPDAGAYIVMEYVPGATLADEIKRRGKLAIAQAIELMRQVCDAVAEAHVLGVIHRDLKPRNILLEEAREGPRVKVLDFGIAKLRGDAAADGASLTRTGVFLGTPAYMAPEQWEGEEADARSDVYSLGCVLYEMLAGRPPFVAKTAQLFRLHTGEMPAPPGVHRPEVGPALDAVVLRALAKEQDDRFQTAAELAAALEGAAPSGPSRAPRAAPGAAETDARAQRPPFVGRRRELAELVDRLERAIGGECQLALVAGEAGAGKTRLLDELEAAARRRGVRVLHGRFAEADQALPYDGFFEVVREYLRLGTATGGTLSDLLPDLVALFPMLAELDVGTTPTTVARPDAPAGGAGPLDDKTAVFETLSTALARMAGGRPLVVCFEELHKAVVSVEALQYAVRRLVPVPILVAGSYRSEEVDKRHPLARLLAAFRGDRRFALVELEPLPPAEHRELVESVLGGPVEDELAARLFQVSEGNPYFATELARSLRESGDLTDGGGVWGLSESAGLLADALPATVQEAARQRIEELPREARELLSLASVLGRELDSRDLEALAGEGADFDDTLDLLVEKGLLEESRRSREDRLSFSSGVMREVLYADLPKRRRRALHRRHAAALEARFAGKLERVLPQLVHHYANADVAEKVLAYGTSLARRSLEAHAADDALRVAETVLEFAREEGDPETEGEARLLTGGAQRMRGNVAAAVSELEAAVRAFEQAGRGDRRLEAIERAAEAAWDGRRAAQARRWVDAGVAAAREAGAVDRLARLLSLGATIANLAGEHDRAKAWSEEAASLRPARDAAGEEAPRGGTLVAGLSGELRARHPAELRFAVEFEVLANAYETLLGWEARGGLAPRLAEAWEARDGGRTFLFTLRAGVRLHDGRQLAARDVKRSLERAARLSARSLPAALAAVRGMAACAAGEAGDAEGIEVAGEHGLLVHLKEALPIYPALLTDAKTAVACDAAGGAPPDGAPPAGTGPFVLRSIEAGGARLERHDAYWGEPARLDALEFRVVPGSAERAALVRSGELDLTGGLEPADLEALVQARPARTLFVEAPKKSTCFLLFNRANAAGAPGLVEALSGVVRVHDLVRSTTGRFAEPAEGLLPPGILGHDPGRRRRPLPRDEAERAVRDSGLAPLTLRAAITPGVQARFERLLEALFAEWAALGVRVSVETPTAASHAASWEAAADFDFTMQEWEADYDDPDNFTYALFHSEVGFFRDYYSSPELDRLIDEARAEPRPAAREGLYRRIEEHLLGTGLLLPLFHGVDCRVAGPHVQGLALSSAPPFVAYSRVGKGRKAAAGGARPGRVPLHVPLPADFQSIDPCDVTSVAAIEASLMVFETLLRANAEARIVPWLAEEYRVEERGRRYRFRLRPDVRFHDGRRLTARDVRYSFERLLHSASDYRTLLAPVLGAAAFAAGEAGEVEGIRILSSTELELELEHPLSVLPALLTCAATAVVPEGTGSAKGSWQTGCVGTGPFRVARSGASGRLELEASPQYWRRGFPRSERLGFTAENESSARAAGFREGRYSIAWLLARADEEALLHDPAYAAAARRIPEIATTLLILNSRRGVFADEGARHRFAQALDVEAFVARVEGRGGLVATGLIPPGLLGHEPQRLAGERTVYDVSNTLVDVTVAMTPPLLTAWGEELVRWLGERGFRVRIVNTTYAEYEAATHGGAVDVVATGWNFDYPDADSIVYGAFHSASKYGSGFVMSPEIDRLCELGRTETDAETRQAIYRQVEEVVARHAHAVPLYHARRWCFARPGVEGVELSLFQPYLSYEKLYVRE